MVTFDANWCLDCRTLYHHPHNPKIQAFTTDTFDFVNVDLAIDLDVDLRRGIPVAIFLGPDGQVIGTTDEGNSSPRVITRPGKS